MTGMEGSARAGVPVEGVDVVPASAADLREARGAIALVASGVAVDVVLCGLPTAEATATATLEEARAVGVGMRVEHGTSGSVDLIVGPRKG